MVVKTSWLIVIWVLKGYTEIRTPLNAHLAVEKIGSADEEGELLILGIPKASVGVFNHYRRRINYVAQVHLRNCCPKVNVRTLGRERVREVSLNPKLEMPVRLHVTTQSNQVSVGPEVSLEIIHVRSPQL